MFSQTEDLLSPDFVSLSHFVLMSIPTKEIYNMTGTNV